MKCDNISDPQRMRYIARLENRGEGIKKSHGTFPTSLLLSQGDIFHLFVYVITGTRVQFHENPCDYLLMYAV